MDKLSKREILAALEAVNGIGKKTAEKIWAKYKSKTPDALINSPAEVAKAIRGVSLKRAEHARTQLLALTSKTYVESAPSIAESITLETVAGTKSLPQAIAAVEPVSEPFLSRDQVCSGQNDRWADVHQARQRAEEVLRKYEDQILAQPNVSGVHVGFRRRTNANGSPQITSDLEVCIRVHVERKLPPNSPFFSDDRLATKIAESLEGIPIDVCELQFTTLDIPEFASEETVDPGFTTVATTTAEKLVGGIEIATKASPQNRGTMGGWVFHGRRLMMMTNAHVAGSGATVTQPGGGPEIGIVEMSAKSSASSPSSLDCSIIRSTSNRDLAQEVKFLPGLQRFQKSALDVTDVHRTTAMMAGAFSKLQSGVVKSVNAVVKIGNSKMPKQIIVESPTGDRIIQAGDSGAWLLTEQISSDGTHFGYNVVGLVHARSKDRTKIVATHFRDIASTFGVTIDLV